MDKLFADLKTDLEKANFFLSGRGCETGVIAQAIQNDVAMAYQRCDAAEVELRRIEKLERINAQLLEALLEYKRLYEEVQPAGGWQGVYETGNDAIAAAKGEA